MATNRLGKGLNALFAAFDEEDAAEAVRADVLADPVAKPAKARSEGTVDISFSTQNRATGTPAPQTAPVGAAAGSTAGPAASLTPHEIDINLIDSNIGQPRKDFDPEKLQELADSIRANGILSPIILTPMGARYMIVAGERRWRAAKIVGLRRVLAIVRHFTPNQIAEVAIVENLQRQDLNEIELARGIEKLMQDFRLTQEQVAVRIGKSRTAVAHTLRLLALPGEIIALVEQGKLSAGHARCLVTVANKERAIKLANQCIRDGLSVRDLEKILQGKDSGSGSNFSASDPKPLSLELKELIRKLTTILSTKVSIFGDNKQGRIMIEYFTAQDLIRIRKHIVDINELVSVDEVLKKKLNAR